EAEGGKSEQEEAGDNGVSRPDLAGDDPTGDATDDGTGTERPDEEPGLELGEVERVDIPWYERDQRPEQHCVEKDDRADDDGESAHRDSLCSARGAAHARTTKNAPSRLPLRPAVPTDLRQSGCRSGSHQPPVLRSRCT